MKTLREVLAQAITYGSTEDAINALGVVCMAPREGAPVSSAECDLVLLYLQVHGKTFDATQRSHARAMFRCFLLRIYLSVHTTELGRALEQGDTPWPPSFVDPFDSLIEKSTGRVREIAESGTSRSENDSQKKNTLTVVEIGKLCRDALAASYDEMCASFLVRVSEWLLNEMYPGSVYARIQFAISLYNILLDVFSGSGSARVVQGLNLNDVGLRVPSTDMGISQYATKEHVTCLLACLWHDYTDIRVEAGLLLGKFPLPLPGLGTMEDIKKLCVWAQRLCESPRQVDADSGARLFQVVERCLCRVQNTPLIVDTSMGGVQEKGVQETGNPKEDFDSGPATTLRRVLAWLEGALSDSLLNRPLHGPLKVLRVLLSSTQGANGESATGDSRFSCVDNDCFRDLVLFHAEFRDRLLNLLCRVCETCRTLVADLAPEGYRLKSIIVAEKKSVKEKVENVENTGTTSQQSIAVMSAWLAIREVGYIAIVFARHEKMQAFSCRLGQELLDVMIQSRHRGAMERAHDGFRVLCKHVHRGQLRKWLLILLARVADTRARITRRSGGLPYALTAIMVADQGLASEAMGLFMDMVRGGLGVRQESEGMGETAAHPLLVEAKAKAKAKYEHLTAPSEDDTGDTELVNAQESMAVHGLNALNHVFRDREMGSRFDDHIFDELLVSCLYGFQAESWSVRSASSLLYASLLRRQFAARPKTCKMFFSDHPRLLAFVLDVLKNSKTKMGTNGFKLNQSEMIFPILVLISRFAKTVDGGDVPFQTELADAVLGVATTHKVFAVRMQAARAWAPLVLFSEALKVCTIGLEKAKKIFCTEKEKGIVGMENRVHGLLMVIRYVATLYFLGKVEGEDTFTTMYENVESQPEASLDSVVEMCRVLEDAVVLFCADVRKTAAFGCQVLEICRVLKVCRGFESLLQGACLQNVLAKLLKEKPEFDANDGSTHDAVTHPPSRSHTNSNSNLMHVPMGPRLLWLAGVLVCCPEKYLSAEKGTFFFFGYPESVRGLMANLSVSQPTSSGKEMVLDLLVTPRSKRLDRLLCVHVMDFLWAIECRGLPANSQSIAAVRNAVEVWVEMGWEDLALVLCGCYCGLDEQLTSEWSRLLSWACAPAQGTDIRMVAAKSFHYFLKGKSKSKSSSVNASARLSDNQGGCLTCSESMSGEDWFRVFYAGFRLVRDDDQETRDASCVDCSGKRIPLDAWTHQWVEDSREKSTDAVFQGMLRSVIMDMLNRSMDDKVRSGMVEKSELYERELDNAFCEPILEIQNLVSLLSREHKSGLDELVQCAEKCLTFWSDCVCQETDLAKHEPPLLRAGPFEAVYMTCAVLNALGARERKRVQDALGALKALPMHAALARVLHGQPGIVKAIDF